MENNEPKNWAKVTLKKSGSSGKTGYDVDVGTDGSITQEELDLITEKAIKSALKGETALIKLGR